MTTKIQDLVDFMAHPFMQADAVSLLISGKIGEGSFRKVYNCRHDDNSVIKIALESYANVLEWEVWRAAKDTKWAKWFAPCISMSPEGYILIQQKVESIKEGDKLPKNIPGFFDDLRTNNFGWIGKQLVCHDYQFINRAFDISMNTTRECFKNK